MPRSYEELLHEALQLPTEQRTAMAGSLLESIDPEPADEVEAAWRIEVRRRIEEVEAGKAVLLPWEELEARLHARLSQ